MLEGTCIHRYFDAGAKWPQGTQLNGSTLEDNVDASGAIMLDEQLWEGKEQWPSTL